MNEEKIIHINSFKFYDRDELEDLTKEYYLENKRLKELLESNSKVNIADHMYASECEDKLINVKHKQQELIDYLKKEIEELENIPKDEQMTLEANGRLIAYRTILMKMKEE